MHLQATMATARLPSAQRSATGLITDTKSRQKDVILQCLTRLNNKSTLRVSAEELSAIIRSLDLDGLGCMVQSICSTGTWEPKPFAKKECLRALGQLPCSTCPAAEVAIQQPYLGKALGHLKRNLQDSDSLVRDAACEALAAYAWAIAEATGAPLPGTSSSASPLIRVLFECLAEQKKEAQLGASQALLLIAPCIGPLDGDLIKLILRLLRSSTFQGTTALLLAVASFDPEGSRPAGLLARGQSAFLPYLKHLIGQPAPRRTSATGPDATAGTKEGGLLGCLCSSDWAVRRAAADAIRAAVLVLGPRMEPHGCWQLGDAGSLTHKCLAELEERRFDKVKEAREAIKEAMVIIQHLHAFVSSIGPVGDWQAWVKAHIPSAGLMSPARADICSTSSPEQSGHECSGDRQATVAALRSSPISRNFQMAAAQADMVADPYSPKAAVQETTAARLQQDNDSNLLIATNGSLGGPEDASGVRQSAVGSATEADAQPDADETSAGVMMNISEGKHNMLQCSGRQRSDVSPDGTTAVGRTSSSAFRRSNSISSSRPLTGESQQLLKRQSSSGRGAIVAHNTQPTAAGVELQPRGRSRSSNDGLQRPGSRNASRSDHGDNQTWSGPNAVEWQKLQQQLLDHQQQLAATQHLLMASQQQQQSLTATVQQMQVHYDGVITALQEQVRDLQQQLQQQEPCADVHIYSGGNGQIPPSQAGPGSPSQLGSRRSSSAIGKSDPGAVAATSHEAPSTATATHGHKSSWRTSEASTADRLFRSADWTTPTSSMPRRPSGSVLNSMSISRRSMNGANTPTSAGLFEPQDAPVQTPSRYDAAFTEALHGDKGEVHLLRLLQKTGIAWHMLSPNTSQDLLKFFIKEVKEGVMLHRVVPWLWRLADDDAARPDIPVRMQQELLEALRNCPAADEIKAQEKVPLLMQTLELCWQQSSRDDEFP